MPNRVKERHLNVMLSSTSHDLPEHREQAISGILSIANMRPIITEPRLASVGVAINESLKLVDRAGIYVGIFGVRYGNTSDNPHNPERMSITELEYRHAMKRGIPVLIFMMSDSHPLIDSPTSAELDEESKKKLEAFRDKLHKDHFVGFFESAEDLCDWLVQALYDPTVQEQAYAFMNELDETRSISDDEEDDVRSLQYAFDELDETHRLFLSQIAAFGEAVPYHSIEIFNPYAKKNINENRNYLGRIRNIFNKNADITYRESSEYSNALRQLDKLLNDLIDSGLLYLKRESGLYDMHRMVRAYAFEQLEADRKISTFERIREHFETQNARDVDDAAIIYLSLVGAGKFDEAARFFLRHLVDNIADHYTAIELLMPLFPNGMDNLPDIDDNLRKGAIIGTLSSLFTSIGHTDEALNLKGLTLKIWIDANDLAMLGASLVNYATSLQNANQIARSINALKLDLALAEATNDSNQIAYSRLPLLESYKNLGLWKIADTIYAQLKQQPPRELYWQAEFEAIHVETLILRGLPADDALQKAEQLAIRGGNAIKQCQLKALLGEVALQAGNYAEAIQRFETCLSPSNQEAKGDDMLVLGGLARAYALSGQHARAQEIIKKSAFDNRHVELAEVYLALNDRDKARENARKAYEFAWADGPTYVWWWQLQRAEKVLDALGEPHPTMTPHDSSSVKKIPYEDEIRSLIDRERKKRK